MIDCFLDKIVRVRHTIPTKINTQTHEYNELTYFISGSGSTCINDAVHSYGERTFAFYKTGTPHNETDPEPCDIIWSHFNYNISDIELKEGVFSDPEGELLACLQRLRSATISQREYRTSLIESCLAEVIITAARLQNEHSVIATGIDWQKIIDYIDENLSDNIDFIKLAKQNHYSYDRFRHLFKEQFGISCYTYLTNQRIERAKRLLKSSGYILTDIAYDCGFNSSSQFTNIFKKYIGVTPKEYRQGKAVCEKN